MSDYIDVAALTKVIVLSLILGAGIPAVFAVGVRALAPVEGDRPRSSVRVSAAVLCFGLCLAAVAYGVYRLVATGGH